MRPRTSLLLHLAPITLFYVAFLVVPYALILRLSLYRFSPTRLYLPELTLANYGILGDPFYLLLTARTLGLAALVTLVCLLVGYPLALRISRAGPVLRSVLVTVTLSPLLINLVVRTYAWLVILGDNGVLNTTIRTLGLVDAPLPLAANTFAVAVGLVHNGLPLMVLSLLAVLDRIDPALADAATTLGATPLAVLHRVTGPLSRPGIAAGAVLVFTFTLSAFVTPALLGGNRVTTISTLIYEKFTFSANWPVGATLVILLLVLNLAALAVATRLLRTD